MKKKKSGILSFLTRKQFRYGWYAVLLMVLVIAVVVVVNVIVGAAEDKWALRIDASPNSITSFTQQTYDALDALDQDVHVYLVFQNSYSGQLKNQLEEITAKYRARNAHVSVDYIDPITEPNRVNQYKTDASATASLGNGAIIVTNADETRVKQIPQSEMYSYTMDQQTGAYSITAFNGESKLTQALMFVTNENTPMVYFLKGHDELTAASCSTLSQILSGENYEVKELTLGKETILKPGDTVVVAAPGMDMADAEYDELKRFLDEGGRMMFAADPNTDMTKLPNFEKLLDYYAIRFKDGMVIEDQNSADAWRMSPMLIVPSLNAEHQITKDLTGASFLLPTPRAIARPAMPLSGYTYDNLLTSSAKSYIKNTASQSDVLTREDTDEMGSQVLAMAIGHQVDINDSTKDTRIVVLGNLYLIADSEFTSSSHNMYFALSAFNWLVNREASVYIRSKDVANTMLNIPSQSTFLLLAAIVILVVPGIILVCGIWVFMKRRRL